MMIRKVHSLSLQCSAFLLSKMYIKNKDSYHAPDGLSTVKSNLVKGKCIDIYIGTALQTVHFFLFHPHHWNRKPLDTINCVLYKHSFLSYSIWAKRFQRRAHLVIEKKPHGYKLVVEIQDKILSLKAPRLPANQPSS